MDQTSILSAVENAARESYGRLLTFLASRSGDVAGAEDALGDAFAAALQQWPMEGIPTKPEAWLLATARKRWIDAIRKDQTRERFAPMLQHAMATAEKAVEFQEAIPDERLKLLFVCAHPAIDVAARTPLMLQTVLRLDAQRIASAFLCAPAAMSQRLVRAKSKIREAGIPFRVPTADEWPERIGFVLDAIYTAYTAGWQDAGGASTEPHDLAGEAIWLARVLAKLVPNEPEVLGLLSLLLHCEARRGARLDPSGSYVPLPDQDTALWNHTTIEEAEAALYAASRARKLGRFQMEAAIQSVHSQRARMGRTDWNAIAAFYNILIRLTPAYGAGIGRAIALCHAQNPQAGWAVFEALPSDRLQDHQPYWAAKAYLHTQLGQNDQARASYQRAMGLTEDPAVREFLRRRLQALHPM